MQQIVKSKFIFQVPVSLSRKFMIIEKKDEEAQINALEQTGT